MHPRAWAGAGALLAAAGITLGVARSAPAPVAAGSAFRTEAADRVVAQPASSTGSCGVERWSVKTGTDADAGLVNTTSSSPTTIQSLSAIAYPSSIPANNRVQPTETTVWRLNATLTQYKLESDSDYHLVLQDPSGHTMITEIPDPACVGSSSPFAAQISSSRASFDAHYSAIGGFQTANVPVTITGVGMFDFAHGQTGAAPNQIELHPVLSITFGSGPTPTPTSPPPPTATPAPTPTPTAPPTPTPTPPPGSTVRNGGFESGLTAWTTGGVVAPSATTAQAHSGSHAAILGSSATPEPNGDSSLAQTIVVPTGNSRLSFWYWPATADTVTYDWQEAQVRSASGATLASIVKVASNARAWQQVGFDMTPYAGQTVSLFFNVHGDGYGDLTWMYLDDVALTPSGPTPAPPPSPTPTPRPTPTATPASTPTPTPSPRQLLGDTGFESGGTATPWSGSSGVFSTSTSEPAHSGSWDAWLCGYGTTHTDTLAQTVTLPAGSTTDTLAFWLHIDTAETTTATAYDTLSVTLSSPAGSRLATLAAYSNLDHGSGYTLRSVDVSAYRGQTVVLTFTGSEDASNQTSFVLDDVTLTAQ